MEKHRVSNPKYFSTALEMKNAKKGFFYLDLGKKHTNR